MDGCLPDPNKKYPLRSDGPANFAFSGIGTVTTDINCIGTVTTEINCIGTVTTDINCIGTVTTEINCIGIVTTEINGCKKTVIEMSFYCRSYLGRSL